MPFLSSFFLVLFIIARNVLANETTKVCHDTTGICFQQFSDSNTRSSLGIVLPPLQNVDADATADPFQQDILVNLTTSFPYGFAGFGRGLKNVKEVKLLGQSLSVFMGQPAPTIGSFQTTMIGQYSDFAPANRTQLIPVMGASIFFSPLSRWDDHFGTFIFRCRNCSLGFTKEDIASDGGVRLNLFRSETKPIYPAPTALNATLLTSNITIASFEVGVDDLRSQEYHNYLQAANLRGWF